MSQKEFERLVARHKAKFQKNKRPPVILDPPKKTVKEETPAQEPAPVVKTKTVKQSAPEHELEAFCIKIVKQYFAYNQNVQIFRRNVGAAKQGDRFIRYAESGQSDYWGIVREVICPSCHKVVEHGRHVEIECKRAGGGKVSPLQNQWMTLMRNYGAKAMTVYTSPSEKDPFGVEALKKQLYWVEHEFCDDCRDVPY